MRSSVPDLYLASSSPRRKDLLKQIGVEFKILNIDVDESISFEETSVAYVERMAILKARTGKSKLSLNGVVVLGADTSVIIDGEILGKPKDRCHGLSMLSLLSGRSHEVLTSLAMVRGDDVQIRTSSTQVMFRCIDSDERERYWETGEPVDKAGAYAIQGRGAAFVKSIKGSYSGVVGLPLLETVELLNHFKIPYWLET